MLNVFLAAVWTALPVMFLVPNLKKIISVDLLASTILVAISFIYVGSAISGSSAIDIAIETLVALLLYCIAVVGYKKDSRLIALGILLHGIWSAFRHPALVADTSPSYWWGYCLIIDVMWSAYFFIFFSLSKRREEPSS